MDITKAPQAIATMRWRLGMSGVPWSLAIA
jgi:hypothetical protein